MAYGNQFNPWRKWIILGVIALVLIIVIGMFVGNYNSLSSANQKVKSTWSQVDIQLTARYDKLTSLAAVVKSYVKHEEKIFTDITNARAAIQNGTVQEKLATDNQLTTFAKSLIALSEDNPELKADTQFTQLQASIEGAQNRVAVARRDFNAAVESYNNKVIKFPGNLFAKIYGFETKDYFEAVPEQKENPDMNKLLQ